jgi:dipeptidase E
MVCVSASLAWKSVGVLELPRIGSDFVNWPAARDDRTLGVVDFAVFPHLNAFPTNTLADAQR